MGAGFQQVPFGTPADCQIVNTCTVTREADRKSAQFVRRAERTGGVVVATGCGVAARGGLKGVGASVLRLPPDQRDDILALLGAEDCPSALSLEKTLRHKRARALLRVQDGCDQFCTFCIVPYVRGRSRSLSAAQLLERVIKLQAEGFQEIVLTGIHLSAWGHDFSQRLSDLLGFLLRSTSGVRFRLGSVEPDLFPREVFHLMLEYPERLCPHLHLVIQHASDRILEKMHRGYTLAHYDSLVTEFVESVPGACLTSDVMVGFPGEEEADFAILRDYIARTPYYHLHVFPYSSRPGTAASKFAGQVSSELKQARRDQLIRLGEQKRRQFQKASLGQRRHVLVEACSPSRGWVEGTADNYLAVRLRGGSALIGKIVQVELQRVRLEWTFAGFPLETQG